MSYTISLNDSGRGQIEPKSGLLTKQMQPHKPSFANKIKMFEEVQVPVIPQVMREDASFSIVQSSRKSIRRSFQASRAKWKNKSFKIISIVSRFIRRIGGQSEGFRLKIMNPKIFKLIGDASSDFSDMKEKGVIGSRNIRIRIPKTIVKFVLILRDVWISLIRRRVPIFMPDDYYSLVWDSTVMIIIIMMLFYFPLELGFSHDLDLYFSAQTSESQVIQFVTTSLPLIIFICDLIAKQNTAYYDKGMLIQNRIRIIKHRLKNQFILDTIVIVMFILANYNFQFLLASVLLKIGQLKKSFERFEEFTLLRHKYPLPADLGKLIFFVIFVCHFGACLWHLVGTIEAQHTSSSWLIEYKLEEASWADRYASSIYWSTITVTTTGYGDVVAQNTTEKLYVSLSVLITSIVFGYILSSIQTIFLQMQQRTDQFKNQMVQVNYFIKRHSLNQILASKIRRYFEYYYQSLSQKEDFLHQLNHDLMIEVKREIYKQYLVQSSFLSGFGDNFVDTLCQSVKVQNYVPGEIIQSHNQIWDRIYFVTKGEVEAFIPLQSKGSNPILNVFGQGAIFDEMGFIFDHQSPYIASAQSFCQLGYIEKADFLNHLSENEQMRQKYFKIIDNLKFNKHYHGVSSMCLICSKFHLFDKCPHIFYVPHISLSKNQQKQQYADRKQFQRRRERSKQPLEKNSHYRIQALDYALKNQFISESILEQSALDMFGLDFSRTETASDSGASARCEPFSTHRLSIRQIKYKSKNDLLLNNVINSDDFTAQKALAVSSLSPSVSIHKRQLDQPIPSILETNFPIPHNSNQRRKSRIGAVEQKSQNLITIEPDQKDRNSIKASQNKKIDQFNKLKTFGLELQRTSRLSQNGAQPQQPLTRYDEDYYFEMDWFSILKRDFLKTINDCQIPGFENLQNYKHFYCHYNFPEVVSNINRGREKQRARTSKVRTPFVFRGLI